MREANNKKVQAS